MCFLRCLSPLTGHLSPVCPQHVMKFAELSQEVLVTKSYQSQAGNGLTPGRRRLHQDNFERLVVGETVRAPFFTAPAGASRVPVVHTLGPPFPMLEVSRHLGFGISPDWIIDLINRRIVSADNLCQLEMCVT